MSDANIRQNVIAELEFEPSIVADHIGVAVENGVVTLSGHVASYAQKLAAEKATLRVKGVKAIAEKIAVRFPGEKKTADDEIAQRVLAVLKWSAMVPDDLIRVKVQNGLVSLDGEVPWQYQREAAEGEVRRLGGVAGVLNYIKVKPRVQPVDVKRKIEDALRRNAAIDASHITVLADGGKVILGGTIQDWRERRTAERAAWSAPGVTGVEDRMLLA